jgi:hypothetical protein
VLRDRLIGGCGIIRTVRGHRNNRIVNLIEQRADRMPSSEDLAAADDAALVAQTLWLRAGDLRRHALLASDRAARGIAPENNTSYAAANEVISARLLRLAGNVGRSAGRVTQS